MTLDIPNYQILGNLGEGAGSRLFLARNTGTGARYTIKVVRIRQPEDMRFVEQLRDEHAIGSAIDHPGVRKSYELRYVRRRLRIKTALLFMEFVDGLPLNDANFSCSLPELLTYFISSAEALHAMHRAGFIHADLKPGNILVTPDKRVKLIDFGQGCKLLTSKPRIQGTIDYMAPEQVSLAPLDPRTDVFGLGATLYKVLTGQPIPTEMNQNVSFHCLRHVGKKANELNQPLEVELAAPIQRLIENCCDKDPAKRPSHMKAVVDRLTMTRDILARQEAETPTIINPPAKPLDDDTVLNAPVFSDDDLDEAIFGAAELADGPFDDSFLDDLLSPPDK